MSPQESQAIITKITQLETKQSERHKEYLRSMNSIDKKLGKLDRLPCEKHSERFKVYDDHVLNSPKRIMWGVGILVSILTILIVGGFKMAVHCGQTDVKITELERHINVR